MLILSRKLGESIVIDGKIHVTVVRVVWLIVALMPPTVGLLAYIVAWIVMPEEPEVHPAPAGQQVTTT